jgi:hypothetical protein
MMYESDTGETIRWMPRDGAYPRVIQIGETVYVRIVTGANWKHI